MMRKTRAQRREAKDRVGVHGGGAKKSKKTQKSYRRDVENGGDLRGRRKKRGQRVLVRVVSSIIGSHYYVLRCGQLEASLLG